MVLLRNEGVLPLDARGLRSVAVIGPNAARAQIMGGGSAKLRAHYTVTPLEALAARLGLADVRPLRPGAGARACKVVVFVPDADLGRVSDAVFAAGAGRIGEYEHCAFELAGTGTFRGRPASGGRVRLLVPAGECDALLLEALRTGWSVRAVVPQPGAARAPGPGER
jgi:hypothetical protein